MQHDAPLHIKLQKSWCLLIVMLALHVGALFSFYTIAIFGWLKVAVTLIVMVHFFYWLQRDFLLRLPTGIVGFSILTDGYQLHFANEQTHAAKLLSSSVVTRFVMVLKFIMAGRMRSVTLLPGSLSREEFRQLRVRLWYSKEVVSQPLSVKR